MVTLFLSCLLLTVAFLPVVWFPWIMHLTRNNLDLGSNQLHSNLFNFSFLANRYTFLYNMSAILTMFIAPICGLIIDYRANRGVDQSIRFSNLEIFFY